MNITTTPKPVTEVAKKFCRVVLTDTASDTHRVIEQADGTTSLQIGFSKRAEMTDRTYRTLVRSLVQVAKKYRIENLAITLEKDTFPQLGEYDAHWFYKTTAENLLLANYEFTKYKTKKLNRTGIKEICLCNSNSRATKSALKNGKIVAEATNTARDIANTSGADMTPRKLAGAAKAALAGTGTKVTVLGETALKKLQANLLLAVGQGSNEPSQMIVMEYRGAAKKTEQPLVLIGKGITYDTGGLNVKPSGSMHEMHLDMSGGAAVIGAIQAIAKLKLPCNVVGIVAAAENAISSEAMRAGDIFTAMNGTTVEVLHTDAEGRLALADALTYSERFTPKMIVDVATLTGAALIALGQHASALLTPHTELQRLLIDLGEETGDYLWPLPLWDEYQKALKSDRADIANIATNFSRYGGTIEGGAFLQNFAPKDVPWAHIDIAPRMTAISSDKLAKGATGEPVRLLVTLAESLAR